MKYKLQDIIDMEHFQNLQDRLNEIYSFPSAIIDNDGNILTATAWQDLCTKFHRVNKESEQHCIQSDQYILSHLHDTNPAVSYRCPHGLVDNATPIIIDGIHYGNYFTGQFFLEKPDIEFFKAQAQKYGFDEDAYLEAVQKVPIWTHEQLNSYLFFIKGLIAVISESGLKKLKEIETRKQIEETEARAIAILETAMDGFWMVDMQGRLLEVNDSYCRMSGYSAKELLSMNISDLEIVESSAEAAANIKNIMVHGEGRFKTWHRRKDESVFDVEVSVKYHPFDGGQLVFFLRDITEEKRIEQKKLAIDSVREKVWLMETSDDIKEVAFAIRNVIEKYIENFHAFGLNIVNMSDDPVSLTVYEIAHNDNMLSIQSGTAGEKVIIEIWKKGKTAYRKNIGEEDSYKESNHLDRNFNSRIMSVIDVPFTHGTLAINSEKADAFSEHDIEFLEDMAQILSEGFKRTEDLKQLEKNVEKLIIDITERKRIEEALKSSEVRYRRLFEMAKDGILILDAETGMVVDANPFLVEMMGFSHEELLGKKIWQLGFLKDIIANQDNFMELQQKEYIRYDDLPLETVDGRKINVEFVSNVYLVDNKKVIQCNIRDITERIQTEEALRESVQNFRTLADSGQALIWTAGTDKLCNYFNRTWLEFTGRKIEHEMGNGWVEGVHLDDLQRCMDIYVGAFDRREKFSMEYRLRRHDNKYRWLLDDGCPRYNRKGEFIGYIGHCLDITDRRLAEEARERIQSQLNQALKMESVGRLAGGVAHDFNNMLTIILGNVEIAMMSLDPSDPLHASLEQIQHAGLHSADLTRQLLAFARKQIVMPKVLDLNETVEGMLKMLRRLIGEDIDLTWSPDHELGQVKIDPSQIDQILANLCVNARDAITDVGKITIETANVVFDENYCADHTGFTLGEYVLLAVSDNGCGMDKKTMANVFEPFFTTKEFGKGTGLGLSTVYGIVKQNNGFINIYSESGEGTTFKIYLPRFGDKSAHVVTTDQARGFTGGSETILLVEDEPSILKMSKNILEKLGYAVLTASTPGKAVQLADEYAGEINLLMTDVVMPEMNGRDLANNLVSRYPHLKRLFMSGYTTHVIAHHGVLDEGVHFIQKPFSIKDLAAKVREALSE